MAARLAADGLEALQYARDAPVALMLLDIDALNDEAIPLNSPVTLMVPPAIEALNARSGGAATAEESVAKLGISMMAFG